MLLDEIIELATDNKQPLPVLLRKCLVLAHQLKNDRLKAWANQELNGYPSSNGIPELPAYRLFPAPALGTFQGGFGSGIKNYPIPSGALEEAHTRYAAILYLVGPISIYQDLVLKHTERSLSFPWPADLVAYYQDKLLDNGMVLVSAYQTLSLSTVAGLLDNVRNRTLNMALELQSEIGSQDLKNITPAEVAQVDRTIINNIHGGTNYFASGQAQVTTHTQNIILGDRKQLETVLKQYGLSDEDVLKLSQAETADGQQKMGATVMGWIKKTAPKVIAAGVKLGVDAGQKLLTEWLKQHYGLGQ